MPDREPTGSKFSSSTTESADACTLVIPSLGASPFCTNRMPFMPVSVEPTESVITRYSGSNSCSCSFTVCEKIAAVLPNDTSDETSTSPCRRSSVSASGRAIASPVTCITFTPYFSTVRHTSSGSKRPGITDVLPSNRLRYVLN